MKDHVSVYSRSVLVHRTREETKSLGIIIETVVKQPVFSSLYFNLCLELHIRIWQRIKGTFLRDSLEDVFHFCASVKQHILPWQIL